MTVIFVEVSRGCYLTAILRITSKGYKGKTSSKGGSRKKDCHIRGCFEGLRPDIFIIVSSILNIILFAFGVFIVFNLFHL